MVQGEHTDYVLDRGPDKLQKNARAIQKILTGTGRLAVFSSGLEASSDTAQRLIEIPWISEHSVVSKVIRCPMLTEDSLKNPSNSASLPAQLEVFTSLVKSKADNAEHTGMVLVVGPEFVTDLPEQTGLDYLEPANPAAFAINRFQLSA
jgi:hypothetical protein